MFNIAKWASAVVVALFHKKPNLRTPRPMFGMHYRFPQDQSYHGCFECQLEVLCPDGRWRRFVWITNHTNPLSDVGREHIERMGDARKELAIVVRYMSDKFIGPRRMGSESVSDEGSLRDAENVGVYVLDPYCRSTAEEFGHPWHGRSYCGTLHDDSLDLSYADKVGDLRLLPCYDTAASGDGSYSIAETVAAVILFLALAIFVALGSAAMGIIVSDAIIRLFP